MKVTLWQHLIIRSFKQTAKKKTLARRTYLILQCEYFSVRLFMYRMIENDWPISRYTSKCYENKVVYIWDSL